MTTAAPWHLGDSIAITWTDQDWLDPDGNSLLVKIEISRNNGSSWATLSAGAPNSGTFAWTVTGAVGTQCLIRLSDPDTPAVNWTSDPFAIQYTLRIDSATPATGFSTGGGTVTLAGQFDDHAHVTATVDGDSVTITAHAADEIAIMMPAHSVGIITIELTDSTPQTDSINYTYGTLTTSTIINQITIIVNASTGCGVIQTASNKIEISIHAANSWVEVDNINGVIDTRIIGSMDTPLNIGDIYDVRVTNSNGELSAVLENAFTVTETITITRRPQFWFSQSNFRI